MFATVSKPKLPKFAAWPLGRERLAAAMAGMELLQHAKLTFTDYIVTRFVSDPKHRQQPYPLVEVYFTRQWKPEGEWEFRVWPIPYDCTSRVRALVNEELLSHLRGWLQKQHEPGPNATRATLSFVA